MSADAIPPTLEALRERAHAVLVNANGVSPQLIEHLTYGRKWGEGILALIALDAPEGSRYLTDKDLEGADAETVRRFATENLRSSPVDSRETVEVPDVGTVTMITGRSVYVASRALVLEDEVAALADDGHGVLFAIPDRHTIHIHVIRDATIVPTLKMMVNIAAGIFGDAASPMSPHVYWWRNGVVEQLTTITGAKAMTIAASPEFTRVFNAVTETGAGPR